MYTEWESFEFVKLRMVVEAAHTQCTHVQSLWENQISGCLIYKCVYFFVSSWYNTVYLILKQIIFHDNKFSLV